jgi:hypothetical protein
MLMTRGALRVVLKGMTSDSALAGTPAWKTKAVLCWQGHEAEHTPFRSKALGVVRRLEAKQAGSWHGQRSSLDDFERHMRIIMEDNTSLP